MRINARRAAKFIFFVPIPMVIGYVLGYLDGVYGAALLRLSVFVSLFLASLLCAKIIGAIVSRRRRGGDSPGSSDDWPENPVRRPPGGRPPVLRRAEAIALD